ncbi:MAG: hypothetical protein ABFD54_00165 [Armatimonadota bacterium]|nr:putative glycoside hydrolase family 15 protein [bacterium]
MKIGCVLLWSFLCVECATPASAALVKKDLLGGIGDCEWGALYNWEYYYKGTDCQWDQSKCEVYPSSNVTWVTKFCATDSEIAAGWQLSTNEPINPNKNIICRITQRQGINGSNCQYVALKNLNLSQWQEASVEFRSMFTVSMKNKDMHIGDTVTFKVDNLRMSDFTGLPAGTTVDYTLSLFSFAQRADKSVPASKNPVLSPNNEVSMTITSDQFLVKAIVRVTVKGGSLGGHQPGFYVDGAHLFIKRAGKSDYETEIVPAPRNKRITTLRYGFVPDDDLYTVAGSYDTVVLSMERTFEQIIRLKYYNPLIKIYLYQTAWQMDSMLTPDTDAICSGFPIGFGEVVRNHPDWLFRYDTYPFSFPDPRTPEWRQVPFYFHTEFVTYPTQVAQSDLQTAWVTGETEKIARYHVDGIFIDGPLIGGPPREREPWEPQSFFHGVVPTVRNAGAQVIFNACTEHLDSIDKYGVLGRACFDPWWNVSTNYPSPNYSNNSPANVPDVFFQEWAFWVDGSERPSNFYDKAYWKRCINDMDTVKQWNTATGSKLIPSALKKRIHMLIVGKDVPQDPADGIDGWLRFGLCSYLLGQNDWSSFGCRAITGNVDLDYSITQKLGLPLGSHTAYNGDEYCRIRQYVGTSDGGMGGVVVVNANPNATRDFVPGADVIDENGRLIPSTCKITLSPHTGRILLYQSGYRYISVIDSPIEGDVVGMAPGTIQGHVLKNRSGMLYPTYVQVKVDSRSWQMARVNNKGQWSISWVPGTQGKHIIYSRAYVSKTDTEPNKAGRTVYCTGGTSIVPLNSIAEALKKPDGEVVRLEARVALSTREMTPGSIYIQDPVQPGISQKGIRVDYPVDQPKIAEVSETVDIVGAMGTQNGARCIVGPVVVINNTIKQKQPVVGMPNSSLGGGDWFYDSNTGAGQRGVTGAHGCNNIGMLVRTWGRVREVSSTSFLIDDGSGAELWVSVPSGTTIPNKNSYVAVTGISSCYESEGSIRRLLVVRGNSDIATMK